LSAAEVSSSSKLYWKLKERVEDEIKQKERNTMMALMTVNNST
jgi:hypothetical protein